MSAHSPGGRHDTASSPFDAKARAELLQADASAPGSDVVPWSGAVLAEVALVKGLSGPAEVSGGAALSGPDGEAAGKALVALGWPDGSWFATVSRSEPDIDAARRAARLRLQLEAVDPLVVIALDETAAADVAEAFELPRPAAPGHPVTAYGRRLVTVQGLASAESGAS
jgi:hypothetical protein